MSLTEHFDLAELIRSDYAIRHDINNMPTDPEVANNLVTLAEGLERVRAVLGRPVIVTSGYRCEAVNRAIGGASNSDHMRGLAADFHVGGMSPYDVCRALLKHPDIGWSALIYEGGWTHVAFPEDGHEPQRMVLTAHFTNGRATYTKGLKA